MYERVLVGLDRSDHARRALDAAKDWGAKVIVLASRGLTDLKGILLGRTTHNLIHLSEIPVIAVH